LTQALFFEAAGAVSKIGFRLNQTTIGRCSFAKSLKHTVVFDSLLTTFEANAMGQFHQPNGVNHKCAGKNFLVPFSFAKKYAQLYEYVHLENAFNF
jgi:hypothetical protein